MNDLRAAYLRCGELAASMVHLPQLAHRWATASALEGYTCGALAGHLVRSLLTVDQYLDTATPGPCLDGIDAVIYFHRALGDADPVHDPMHESVRVRSAELAGADATGLRTTTDALLDRLRTRLPDTPDEVCVTVFGGMRMHLDDYLDTRFVELLVHLDDLAVSLDVATPEPPELAARRTVAVLAELARLRHGTAAVLRTLARTERAPTSISAV